MELSMQARNAVCPRSCGHVLIAKRCFAQRTAGVYARPVPTMCQSLIKSGSQRQSTDLRQQRHMLSGAISIKSSRQCGSRGRAPRGCPPLCAGRDVDFADRAVASLPYLVPLFDGLKYGRFLFAQFPALANLLSPLNPLISLYFSFPFASLIVFFAIYSGIVNNFRFSRFVRFNALQSILLDIILIVPGLLEQVIRPPMGGAGLTIYIQLYNSIFFFVFASVLYAVGSCLAGSMPRLPLVADAADQQVR